MKKALISVFNKDGIVQLAKELEKNDYEIISTGGTFELLKKEGLSPISVEEVTEFPEILGGRVKTLNPKIHGGLLYRRELEEDYETIKELEIPSIDVVVNNLYPFEDVANSTDNEDEIIEMIDIGGPSMIRAAAKNFKSVSILTDISDYEEFIMRLNEDKLDLEYRKSLAKKAFETTAYYDSKISQYFLEESGEEFPETLVLGYKRDGFLRYGENPHQKAAFYQGEAKHDLVQLQGKEISYNNLNDLIAAVDGVRLFEEPAIVAIKHTNPCGMAIGETLTEAYRKAYECDTESIFGGIIAANRPLDAETAEEMNKIFLEVIVAPEFTEEALHILGKKKNLRLIEYKNYQKQDPDKMHMRQVLNGILYQEKDLEEEIPDLKVVTKRKPTEEEMKNLLFAFKAVRATQSNSVIIAKDGATLGIGQGETKRSWAVEKAIERSGAPEGVVLASDGFFFVDTMEALNEAGIKAIIQPGGSVKDPDVIEYADANDMTVVFTGVRHFRH